MKNFVESYTENLTNCERTTRARILGMFLKGIKLWKVDKSLKNNNKNFLRCRIRIGDVEAQKSTSLKNNNKLVIPIFHSDFDALQVLSKRFGKIPPHGDFGDFLVAACALAIFS